MKRDGGHGSDELVVLVCNDGETMRRVKTVSDAFLISRIVDVLFPEDEGKGLLFGQRRRGGKVRKVGKREREVKVGVVNKSRPGPKQGRHISMKGLRFLISDVLKANVHMNERFISLIQVPSALTSNRKYSFPSLVRLQACSVLYLLGL